MTDEQNTKYFSRKDVRNEPREIDELGRRPVLKGTGLGALAFLGLGAASASASAQTGPNILSVETGKGSPDDYVRSSEFDNRWNSSMAVFTTVDGLSSDKVAWGCTILKNNMTEIGTSEMHAEAVDFSPVTLKAGFSTSGWDAETRMAVVAVIDIEAETSAVASTTFEVH